MNRHKNYRSVSPGKHWFPSVDRRCDDVGVYRQTVEGPQSRRTEPLLLIYSFQFRSDFRATTTPSQPQIRRPYKAPISVTHRQHCEINSSIGVSVCDFITKGLRPETGSRRCRIATWRRSVQAPALQYIYQ